MQQAIRSAPTMNERLIQPMPESLEHASAAAHYRILKRIEKHPRNSLAAAVQRCQSPPKSAFSLNSLDGFLSGGVEDCALSSPDMTKPHTVVLRIIYKCSTAIIIATEGTSKSTVLEI